ncbi:growth hormone-regulated TBC protein 1-A [Tribolium madens]|uniref:growth hormone-regulated TBC protein 1-A n=1 Tax=Tribolium madens TaxID=41895 RepID=UPI001CF74324|nr:growth hormone-regulated TBC protein 1-A [Tribolium madens]XP_044267354.1 growth hormone-regulated TBC protein 1-A [Tribolium madens]
MAKSSYSKVDEYGFERPDNFNYEAYDEFMSNYMRILTRRSLRWNTIKDSSYGKSNTLKRFIRKGIPSDRRVAVWMSTSGASKLRDESPYTYQELKRKINNRGLIETIQIDLPRTFPDNIYFTNHEHLPQQLFNVLATFAHQNSEVGYCQGLNYIAGLLLLATKSEEASFWLLKTLVEKILPKYYIPSMAGLLTDLDVLNVLIQKSEPTIHQHIQNIGMPWALGTTKWFICLYSEVLPTETVLRIWDCLFYEGSKILLRVAITLIKIHKPLILQTSELSELIACFRNMRSHENVINCHQFMNDVFKLPGSFPSSNLEKLRRKYQK